MSAKLLKQKLCFYILKKKVNIILMVHIIQKNLQNIKNLTKLMVNKTVAKIKMV